MKEIKEVKETLKEKYEHPQIECLGKLNTLIQGASAGTGPGGDGNCTPMQQMMGEC